MPPPTIHPPRPPPPGAITPISTLVDEGSVLRDAQVATLEGIKARRYWSYDAMFTRFNPERRTPLGLDPSVHGPGYIFISRPDLNLYSGGATTDGPASGGGGVAESYLGTETPIVPQIILRQLTASAPAGGGVFIPLYTNTCTSFPHQDISLDTMDMWENWSGNKMTLPKDTVSSRQGGQITLEFQEYAGAPVSLMTRLWVEYIDGVSKGRFHPSEVYLNNRVLDYAVSIYAFLMEPDGMTIEWASKYTGCFPSAIPGSAFSTNLGGADGVKVSVPFNYSYYETMDPAILTDFNSAHGNNADAEPLDLRLATLRPSVTNAAGAHARVGTKRVGNRIKYVLEFPSFADNDAIERVGI